MVKRYTDVSEWKSAYDRYSLWWELKYRGDADTEDNPSMRSRWHDSHSAWWRDSNDQKADPSTSDGDDNPRPEAASPADAITSQEAATLVSPASLTDEPIRVEAEDLNLLYYRHEAYSPSDASGSGFIGLWNWLGKAWGRFDGPEGLYDVTVAYFDESDGNALARMTVDGESTLIRFDQDTGSTLPTAETKMTVVTHESIFLEENDYFEILARASGADYARIDYIEFTPVAETPEPEDPDQPSDPGDEPGDDPDDDPDDDDGSSDPEAPTLDAFEAEVLRLTNEYRAQYGLDPFVNDDRLNAAAEDWSQTMAEDDFFAHSSPSQIEEEGYRWRAWGENIAAGYGTPEQVVQGWINSPGHRANILSNYFEEIGVGHYYEPNDTGNINYNHYWTQVFATEAGDGTYYA